MTIHYFHEMTLPYTTTGKNYFTDIITHVGHNLLRKEIA